MINHLQIPSSSATMALVGISALMATGQAHWPAREEPAYAVPPSISTVSFFERTIILPAPPALDFEHEIASIYAALSEGQEPLGAEFEAAWEAIAPSLYEA